MASDFWDDQEAAQKILQELNQLKGKLENYDFLVRKYEDLETLLELCMETEDADLQQELVQDTKAFMKLLEKTKLETLLSGKHDAKNAILSLHAGAGGTEAQDWVSMLLRMYTRWAEDKGYKVTTLDILPGDEAGVKSVTILVEGLNAYGYLKAEKGFGRHFTAFVDLQTRVVAYKFLGFNQDLNPATQGRQADSFRLARDPSPRPCRQPMKGVQRVRESLFA